MRAAIRGGRAAAPPAREGSNTLCRAHDRLPIQRAACSVQRIMSNVQLMHTVQHENVARGVQHSTCPLQHNSSARCLVRYKPLPRLSAQRLCAAAHWATAVRRMLHGTSTFACQLRSACITAVYVACCVTSGSRTRWETCSSRLSRCRARGASASLAMHTSPAAGTETTYTPSEGRRHEPSTEGRGYSS